MVILAFVLLRLLLYARRQSEETLKKLLTSNVDVYLERLENNKLLKLVFRKPVLLLYRLDGYLKTGDDGKALRTIRELDGMKLEPRDKVEFLQKRMSFFVSTGDEKEARASLDRLRIFLHSVQADEVEKYKTMLDEGQEIIRVYLDRDVSYMDALLAKAKRTEHPVLRGVMYFRLAKLAHFKGDKEETERDLRLAGETLGGTAYEEIIRQALVGPEILETK